MKLILNVQLDQDTVWQPSKSPNNDSKENEQTNVDTSQLSLLYELIKYSNVCYLGDSLPICNTELDVWLQIR